MSEMNGKFVEKKIDLTSSEPDSRIFCATDRRSDGQSHVLYCALCVCVCVSMPLRSGQARCITLSLLVLV
jgi:hypothetical protein